jgi:hypothetical protein
MMQKMERAIGKAQTLRFLAGIGQGLTEHSLVQNNEAGGGANLTPAEAKTRISALRSDRAWTAAYIAGDPAKQAEMNRLHRMAFPAGEA